MTVYQQPPDQPGQYPPQMPGYPAMQQPPRKKGLHPLAIVGIVLAAIAVLCIGGFVVLASQLGSDDDGGGGQTVGLNEPAGDGQFSFTVTGVECGIESVGDGFLAEEPQGQFCLVHVTVRNTGNEARTFDASNQYAFNADGARYDADGSASLVLPGNEAFLEDINPGNSIEATVVFDIPKGASIVRLELHDSAFSGGVVVNVT